MKKKRCYFPKFFRVYLCKLNKILRKQEKERECLRKNEILNSIDDIKIGDAKILTVLDGVEVGEFSIKITSVNKTKDKLKNIQFEITDETLLDKTNGIVQGMSGSPIIQNDYIVGAVTHVVVNDPHKGYGILITNMLEEAEN